MWQQMYGRHGERKNENRMKKPRSKPAPKGSKSYTPGPKVTIYESADRLNDSVSITSRQLKDFIKRRER